VRDVASQDPTIPTDCNALLLTPTFGSAVEEACLGHVTGTHGAETAVLSVLFRERATDRLETLRAHSDELSSVAVVDVGKHEGTDPGTADHGAVKHIGDPADLTGIGMAIDQCLQNWHGDVEEITVCVDSLSTLHQYTDHKRAFRFLHTITNRLGALGVDAHFHLDPAAHDTQTVARVRQLFDDVCELSDPAAIRHDGSQAVATDGGQATGVPPGNHGDDSASDRGDH
jgi:hypothetical protein